MAVLLVLTYNGTMAGPTNAAKNQELDVGPKANLHAIDKDRRTLVREHCAKLYGQGWKRSKVARIMIDHLVPNGMERPLEQRLSQARAKLRRWEQDEEFRNMIYHKAVVELDMATPEILKGLASKAKRGRVDATRLALELTGRHNPKGDQVPAQVVVAINGIPRPYQEEVREMDTDESVAGEIVAEEDG